MGKRKHIEYVGTIVALKRLNNSVNGNPRWEIFFEGGTSAKTQSDASVGYDINNFRVRDYPVVVVKATPAGRIWDVKPLALDCCVNWHTNAAGDCGGRIEIVNDVAICENCRNKA